jgi:hypothetical protein
MLSEHHFGLDSLWIFVVFLACGAVAIPEKFLRHRKMDAALHCEDGETF